MGTVVLAANTILYRVQLLVAYFVDGAASRPRAWPASFKAGAIGPDSNEAVPALTKLKTLKIGTAKKPEVNEKLEGLEKELHAELENALKAITP